MTLSALLIPSLASFRFGANSKASDLIVAVQALPGYGNLYTPVYSSLLVDFNPSLYQSRLFSWKPPD